MIRMRYRTGTLAIALAAALLAAGCGDDGGGSAETGTETETETTEATESPDGDDAQEGAAIFAANCQSCHGELGAGGGIGPSLQASSEAEDAENVEQIVRTGRGQMPSFDDQLDDEEIQAVASYVAEDLAPRG